ncbi:AraC family transcriptional regulator [Curtobacterium sp. MCPF17_002]|uniref:AraC family transcriptional regulator n=1 Tax=Curtobacterium sp. MCPF17_002 TaxID=2175645 RepID=UPI000DA9E9E4|nr:AraC family transcriptional regulator [Curtobacterium sp. MCPF17_002]WIB77436.1 AraC family transcriptional regulator [Curtobacterium sp. MCPF17_002]
MQSSDVFQAMTDLVGLSARFGAAVPADRDSDWTFVVPCEVGRFVWVSTEHRPLWLASGTAFAYLHQGDAALVRSDGEVSIRAGAEGSGPPAVDASMVELLRESGLLGAFDEPESFADSGVFHGTAAFGPLEPEVLALPPVLSSEEWTPTTLVVREAHQLLDDLSAGSRGGLQRDALAGVIVTALLDRWTPPVLRDGSLRRAVERIVHSTDAVPVPELARITNVTDRTLLRRFRETTGRTPDGFQRWWRTLPVRGALLDGADEETVARTFGYSSVRAMRRSVERVARTGSLAQMSDPAGEARGPRSGSDNAKKECRWSSGAWASR